EELSRLLFEYRYFARFSQVERFKGLVQPEVERMRKVGAYVELRLSEPVPYIEGVPVAHVEPSETDGFKRAYFFHAEDYPDIAHHERVCRERGLEVFLEVYDLVNHPRE